MAGRSKRNGAAAAAALAWVSTAACPSAPVCPDSNAGAAVQQGAAAPREALASFLAAVERNDFEAVWRLLAAPVRARYTPQRLAQDYTAVRPSADDRLARARLALKSEPVIRERIAEFPVAGQSAVRLVMEPDGWKVEALE